MNKFLTKTIAFLLIFSLPLIIGLFLPATPRASKSLIFSSIQKDSLMQNVASPRIIFIGGSNLSFGLNSQMIKDSLQINPINSAIHASIGIIYMMDNALEYIKENDIIVLIPEYQQFFGSTAYGSNGEELTRVIFDINTKKLQLIHFKQFINIVKTIPSYSISKFKPKEYLHSKENVIYGVHSFNEYGDAYKHWGLERIPFKPFSDLDSKNFNSDIITKIKEFQKEVEKKNATLYVSYPGYQDLSYLNSKNQIKEIQSSFKKSGFNLIGTPERYMIPDSLMFNTPYHLSKNGADYRTKLFIEDFKNVRTHNIDAIH